MKKIFLFLLLLYPFYVYSDEVKITSYEGEVFYRNNANEEWKEVSNNIVVSEGGAIKTGINGLAVLEMKNKSKIWLKENTALEIEQKKDLVTRLGLVFGKIKARIPHLLRKEKYEIRTITAVCAVRGTDLVMESNLEGKMELEVLFGEVLMTYVIPPFKGKDHLTLTQGEYIIAKGKDKPGIKSLMSKEMEINALSDWSPNLNEKQRFENLKEKEIYRAILKDYSRRNDSLRNTLNNFIYKGRENDLEAGRTLRDIQGNLVRVDQRLMRTDPSTLQFINLVKRPIYKNYDYSSSFANDKGFKYNGGEITNRYDMAIFTMNFNKNLPESLSDWPGFFSKSDVNPNYSSFIFANRSSSDNSIFFIGEGYRYDPLKDELYNDLRVVDPSIINFIGNEVLLTGIIKDDITNNISFYQGLNEISKLNIKDSGSGTGDLVYQNTNISMDGKTIGGAGSVKWAVKRDPILMDSYYEQKGDTYFYQFKANKYDIGNNSVNGSFWLAEENYIISNSGTLRKREDILNTNSDPFSIFKDNAYQSIMYLKDSLMTNGGIDRENDYSLSNNRNIDIVVIPDLAVAGIQRVFTAINELKK